MREDHTLITECGILSFFTYWRERNSCHSEVAAIIGASRSSETRRTKGVFSLLYIVTTQSTIIDIKQRFRVIILYEFHMKSMKSLFRTNMKLFC